MGSSISPKKLNSIVQKALLLLKVKNSYADIFLVSNAEIQKLNRKFRKKNKPTNVLSFPAPDNFPQTAKGKKYLGDIFLSPEYIESHGESVNFMLVHGLLHLLGFDHVKDGDRIEMEKAEQRLMSALKLSK